MLKAKSVIFRESLAAEIKTIRKAKKMKQSFVAESLGIGQPAYSKMESGKQEITIYQLFRIRCLFEAGLS